MGSYREPKFGVGETAIIQSKSDMVEHLWGQETVILEREWTEVGEGFMRDKCASWMYKTDAPIPDEFYEANFSPDLWRWCECELKKKHDPGDDFHSLMKRIKCHNTEDELV